MLKIRIAVLGSFFGTDPLCQNFVYQWIKSLCSFDK